MFAKTIVTSDAFLDMPMSARCLYFTLSMFADDDGFVNNPKSIMRQCGASQDDMNVLIAKKFVLVFESGIIVIKHWRIHNYIQNDRYKPTKYKAEKEQLEFDENGAYKLPQSTQNQGCIQDVSNVDTQVRLGKVSIGFINKTNTNKSILSGKPDQTQEVVDYLNNKIGTNYKATSKKTVALINARFKEGFTVENFKTVIDKKVKSWKKDDEMRKFLRPETLFGTKFESYLNELEGNPELPTSQPSAPYYRPFDNEEGRTQQGTTIDVMGLYNKLKKERGIK